MLFTFSLISLGLPIYLFKVMHFIVSKAIIVWFLQSALPLLSTNNTFCVLTPSPFTTAVMSYPPEFPTLGVIYKSFGVILRPS